MAIPRPIYIPVVKKHTATIICAHGLGDSGAGWSFLAEQWRRHGKFEEVAFIFPSAPMIPITVNMGMRMPGWYDIISFDTINRTDDETGILRSRSYLHSLITTEIKEKSIPASRIILGGFSQGGAMSLFSGLTYPSHRLAGVFGLSCYQLAPARFDALRAEEKGDANRDVPVWMGHGDRDPTVKVEWGRETAEGLRKRGWDVTYREYKGLVHSPSLEEIDELEKWVTARLEDGKTAAAGASTSS